ncbi:MAG: hypothetical protein IJ279_06385 [Clostridia bacterium]|nr:hypothetical protein [Clostridia bacterium]
MKPFYGIDNTINNDNEKENGDEFLIQKPDEKLYKEYDNAVNGVLAKIGKKFRLPFILKIFQYLFCCAGFIFLSVLAEIGFSSEAKNQVFNTIVMQMICVVIICTAGFLILHFAVKKLKKKEEENDAQDMQSRKVRSLLQQILNDLGVPSYACEIDVLSFNYEVQKDEIKIDKCGMSVPLFNPMSFNIFKDEENFYLVCDSGKYAFKLSSIKNLHRIENKNALFFWNKSTPCNEGDYKKYKMREDEMGNIRCKAYYILEIEKDGETWGIYLPEYEKETIEKIKIF